MEQTVKKPKNVMIKKTYKKKTKYICERERVPITSFATKFSNFSRRSHENYKDQTLYYISLTAYIKVFIQPGKKKRPTFQN